MTTSRTPTTSVRGVTHCSANISDCKPLKRLARHDIQDVSISDDTAVNWCSRSLKVIHLSCNRKPIHVYDLLAINCHLSSISHRFWDMASRTRSKTTPHSLSPGSRGLPSNFVIKLSSWTDKALGYILVKNCMILASAVLSQYTRVTDRRQTDRRQTTFLWE